MVWPLIDTSASVPAPQPEEEPKPKTFIFARITGVTGSVKEKGFEGCVNIEDVRWSSSMTIRSPWYNDDDAGEVNENEVPPRETSDPYVSEVTISKQAGPESAMLLFNFMSKKAMEVTITNVEKPASGPVRPLQSFTVYTALVSGYVNNMGEPSSSYRNRSANSETVTFNFTALQTAFHDAQGVPVHAVHHNLFTHTTTLKSWNAGTKQFEVADVYKKPLRPRPAEEDQTGAAAAADDDDEGDDDA